MSETNNIRERNAAVAKVIHDNSATLTQMTNPAPVPTAKPAAPTATGEATITELPATTE